MKSRVGVALVFVAVAAALYGYSQNGSPHPATAFSPIQGTRTLITEPDDGIAPVLLSIESASSSVELVMYQLEDPQVEQALADDAARGVTVRVLLNGGYYGKRENADNDAAYQFLASHGVQARWTPSYFALTHQKTLIVDDAKALIMTFNLTPQYYASSRDFAIADTDPADISAIAQAFDDDWNDDQASAPPGDDLVWSPGSESALLSLIRSATDTLDIYNEEMNDAAITSALEDAARRGVAVRVDMTYSSAWKPAFASLTQSGAQVRTYAAKAPLYIHAKAIIADGARVFLGSENFSSASLDKNRELGISSNDPSIIAALESSFERDWGAATPFQP